MYGNRFDDLARAIASSDSRRTLLKRAIGGLAVTAGLGAPVAELIRTQGGKAAAVCRAGGEICRKDGDCCSGACAGPDATGRKRCTCQSSTTACGTTACCAAAEICVNGACRRTTTAPTSTNTATATNTPTATPTNTPTDMPTNTPIGGCATDADCDDGIDCTEDFCNPLTGQCVHTPIDDYCGSADPCFVLRCDPTEGCVTEPKNCDDGNPCNLDVCDEITGACDHFPNTALCQDGLVCTADTCIPDPGGATFQCQHVFDPNKCGFNPASDCASFTCGAGKDCVLVYDDSKCTGGQACQRGVCTTSGCTYVNNCQPSECNPVCENCTCAPVPLSDTWTCLGTCGV